MPSVIASVDPGSPAARAGILAGEALCAIDGKPVHDVLDYKFYSYDAHLELEIEDAVGMHRAVTISKMEGEPLGQNEALLERLCVLLYRSAAARSARYLICQG